MDLKSITRDCIINMGQIPPLRGGGVELYDEGERARLAYDNLKLHSKVFRRMGEKFDKFRRRVEHRAMRMLFPTDIGMIKPTQDQFDAIRVETLEQFDEAIKDGYEYNPASLNGRLDNPCREILIDNFDRNEAIALASGAHANAQVETRVHRAGSPYPMHLNHAQLRMIARGILRWLMPCGKDSVIIECLPHMKLSKTVVTKLKSWSMNVQTTEMIHWFYNEKKVPQYWHEIRSMRANLRGHENLKKFCAGVACFLYDGVVWQKPCPPDWKTSTVIDLCRAMREAEDFGLMPILADALQDAGCDDEKVLNHYRNPLSLFSLGSWIFRATGTL